MRRGCAIAQHVLWNISCAHEGLCNLELVDNFRQLFLHKPKGKKVDESCRRV